jgi:hypothetical protein
VKPRAASGITRASSGQFIDPSENPASGASRSRIVTCTVAIATPPRLLPSTSATRETGAASTAWRKPWWRSSMTEIVEKIAVNSSVSTTTPG